MTRAEIYRRAAEHLDRVGLFRGDYFRNNLIPKDSPCCVMGAIKVVTGSFYSCDMPSQVTDLSSIFGEHISDINDREGTKETMVLALLFAAAIAEQGER